MPTSSFRRLPLASLLSFALVFAGTYTARAQAPDQLHTATRQELDVAKVLLVQQAAWNNGDLNGFTASYKDAPDTLFVANPIERGFAGLLAGYRHNYPNKEAMGTLTYSDLEVRPLGADYAVCLGKYHLERSKKAGGPAEGIFSLVFEKTPQGWKIIIDHTS